MMHRRIFTCLLLGSLILVMVIYYGLYSPAPDFDQILRLSRLQFKVAPVVLGWETKDFSALDADYSTTVEFRLSEEDAVQATKCLGSGYQKGFYGEWTLPFKYSKPPMYGEEICIRRDNVNSGTSHSFMIYKDILVYDYSQL